MIKHTQALAYCSVIENFAEADICAWSSLRAGLLHQLWPGLSSYLAVCLEQGCKVRELREDAADAPHVDSGGVAGGPEQQLRTPVVQRHHLDTRTTQAQQV